MYDVTIYPVSPNLWRWEIRSGGSLLRCGTSPTRLGAEKDVHAIILA